jgi:hypothetical protein
VKTIGTKPSSIAAPFDEKVVAVDIANTAVARGRIYVARQNGVPIPETRALTWEGHRPRTSARRPTRSKRPSLIAVIDDQRAPSAAGGRHRRHSARRPRQTRGVAGPEPRLRSSMPVRRTTA